ncbi:hypothetical protein D3C81_1762900 [compost metagenome]
MPAVSLTDQPDEPPSQAPGRVTVPLVLVGSGMVVDGPRLLTARRRIRALSMPRFSTKSPSTRKPTPSKALKSRLARTFSTS